MTEEDCKPLFDAAMKLSTVRNALVKRGTFSNVQQLQRMVNDIAAMLDADMEQKGRNNYEDDNDQRRSS